VVSKLKVEDLKHSCKTEIVKFMSVFHFEFFKCFFISITLLLLGCEMPTQSNNKYVNISVTPTILHRSSMPTTTISFSLSIDSDVNIVVYGQSGNEVEILVDEFMVAGYHSVTWDASLQSSGVYFVYMSAGDMVSTQKLMLIK